MANNIFWGQGANTNLIGWGQGAINNIINWGKIYFTSYTGETDITGAVVTNIISGFEERVISEAGIFEAESCLNITLTNLNSI